MRIFKCDVCGTPFVYASIQQCNLISLRNMDLNCCEQLLSPKQINLFNPYGYDRRDLASYNICPSCFDKLRTFLWGLSDRKVSET